MVDMSSTPSSRYLSRYTYVIGFIFIAIACLLVLLRYIPGLLAFADETSGLVSKQTTIFPQKIIIDSIGLNVPIVATNINNGVWGTTRAGISYLSRSPLPGETGNSILYGHNFSYLLGNLYTVQPGDKIDIVYSDSHTQAFIISHTSYVSPDHVDILEQTEDVRITLYTCAGFLDSQRFVVVAFPVN